MATADHLRSHSRERANKALTPGIARSYSSVTYSSVLPAPATKLSLARAYRRICVPAIEGDALAHSIATIIVGERSCRISMAS